MKPHSTNLVFLFLSLFEVLVVESKPLSSSYLPGPRMDPRLLGTLNLTMDDIINSPPIHGGKCTQQHALLNSDGPSTRAAINDQRFLWNQGYINFQIDARFSSNENQLIQNGMSRLANLLNGCLSVNLLPSNSNPTGDYVFITSKTGSGCWSNIGRVGGRQVLYLESSNNPDVSCVYEGTAIHEMFHALGFYHEHVRRDRDNYVNIYDYNANPNQRYNFDIQPNARLFTPYDYYSIMHYGEFEFSANGQRTIQAKNSGIVAGRRAYPTDLDRSKLRQLYGCAL